MLAGGIESGRTVRPEVSSDRAGYPRRSDRTPTSAGVDLRMLFMMPQLSTMRGRLAT